MRQSQFRQALIAVTQKIRANEPADMETAIVGAAGDWEHYIQQAAEAALAKDKEKLKKNIRDAQMVQNGMDIALPGMEHAALVAAVFDDDGTAIPGALASRSQQKAEISKMRRSVNIRDRVVAGYEATQAELDRLGVPEEAIAVMFPREIEAMRDSHSIFTTLLMRDGDHCYLCGQGPDSDDPLEIEHVKPRRAGGTNDLSNLALAHRSCNRTKGTAPVVRSTK